MPRNLHDLRRGEASRGTARGRVARVWSADPFEANRQELGEIQIPRSMHDLDASNPLTISHVQHDVFGHPLVEDLLRARVEP